MEKKFSNGCEYCYKKGWKNMCYDCNLYTCDVCYNEHMKMKHGLRRQIIDFKAMAVVMFNSSNVGFMLSEDDYLIKFLLNYEELNSCFDLIIHHQYIFLKESYRKIYNWINRDVTITERIPFFLKEK